MIEKKAPYQRKPAWLKADSHINNSYVKVGELLVKYGLNSVCQAARCPNRRECYSNGTTTFMLLGANCTRNCAFCNVKGDKPEAVNPEEPNNIAKVVAELKLKHVVVTSVTRDDLADGGASHFANTIKEIRKLNEGITIEVLIPDFQGSEKALEEVIAACPDVINHNVETIEKLYPSVRPEANFAQSLQLLKRVKEKSAIPTKSGFMVGLGESEEEVFELLKILRSVECDIVTIGQYLQPSKAHPAPKDYIHPKIFKKYYDEAIKLGFSFVVSAPLARSSYKAYEELDYIK